uniref:uncharacterized protein LOC120348351 n=1 Tax=Styela clava TaxID=7725 RepID=UPI00193AB01B|nr:uncharacterized protein LOC120348351 [Styela clava]
MEFQRMRILGVAFVFFISQNEGKLIDTLYVGDYELTYYKDGKDKYYGGEDIINVCGVKMPGSRLVIIDNEEIHEAVKELLKNNTSDKSWIGAFKNREPEEYYWMNGEKLKAGFTNWAENEPTDVYVAEYVHVAFVYSYLKWFGEPNLYYTEPGFICQTRIDKLQPSYYAELSFGDTNSTNTSVGTMAYWDAQKMCTKNQSRIVDIFNDRAFFDIREKCASDPTLKYWIRKGENSKNCLIMGSEGWSQNDCDDPSIYPICEKIPPWGLRVSNERPVIKRKESITIDCRASGYPIPMVGWQRNDETVSDDLDQRIHQIKYDGMSRLVITNAHSFDEGRYHCFANSSIHSVRGYADLRVICFDEELRPERKTIVQHNFTTFEKNFGQNKISESNKPSAALPSFGRPSINNSEHWVCSTWKFSVIVSFAVLWLIVILAYTIYICHFKKTTKSADLFRFNALDETASAKNVMPDAK